MVTWRNVRPHHDRGAVFMVADSRDLVEVAMAVVCNDVESVEAALADASLVRLEEAVADGWTRDGAPPLRVLIAQPFVLVQTFSPPTG